MNDRMPSSMKQEEWDYLANHLRVTTAESADRTYSISARDLVDEHKCGLYLDGLANLYRSPSRAMTASPFAKRYAFLIVSPGLYAMTMYNRGLDLSIGNCHVESYYQKTTWMPNMRLAHVNVTQPASAGRNAWRDQILSSMFAGHLAQVWRTIAKASNIPRSILWENTAIYVYTLYEKRILEAAGRQEQFRMQEDFEYLIRDAPAGLFGEKYNPFARFDSPKCIVPASDQPIRIRKTCCYYYMISDHESYCPSCPKVN
ncbi:IucA/IucC family C-terminal-domain containing protein [Paenibacillus validus]|uniref:IucA/IucC family C-terminal-domain containing protein n=1 Tax=Paenibacillus validus TaxID=44253 RepID=UPI003D273BC3